MNRDNHPDELLLITEPKSNNFEFKRNKQIKSTDWLIRGYTEEELTRMKAEAIKEAEAELRDKQIEEMDTILRSIFGCQFAYKIDFGKYGGFERHKEVYTKDIAKELTAKGYRKAEDVAREIFEEIEEIAGRIDRNNMSCLRTLSETTIEKLKKKYTEGEG